MKARGQCAEEREEQAEGARAVTDVFAADLLDLADRQRGRSDDIEM